MFSVAFSRFGTRARSPMPCWATSQSPRCQARLRPVAQLRTAGVARIASVVRSGCPRSTNRAVAVLGRQLTIAHHALEKPSRQDDKVLAWSPRSSWASSSWPVRPRNTTSRLYRAEPEVQFAYGSPFYMLTGSTLHDPGRHDADGDPDTPGCGPLIADHLDLKARPGIGTLWTVWLGLYCLCIGSDVR